MAEDGSCFKATLNYSPYFFIKCHVGSENDVEEYIRRRFENTVESIQRIQKEDLDLPNHLSGARRPYLKLSFRNTSDLLAVRKVLLPVAVRNGEVYRDGVLGAPGTGQATGAETSSHQHERGEHSALDKIVGIREYDIPYHLRVAIDLDFRVGLWYTVSIHGPRTNIIRVINKDVRPDLVVLAFDIETSKMPLKFPDAKQDHIMMISYMINGRGFLIVNRDIVSQDIDNFEYTPKPDFPGHFTVYNVADEQALLSKFFAHIQLVRPQVFVTYNGDFFDWPFIEVRAAAYGMDMREIIGIGKNSQDEYYGTYCAHMDCFAWVKRDSYLPAGSHGLKAVCAIKLGYDPLELDPELMTPFASQNPQILANYSVSDAVATYYLYMKYVHPFIFSLCNIIPLAPDEVLRKGTGTLCETLLMAQAYKANVIMPNKHEEPKEQFHKGHLLDSETYIGGHVEALEAGVYRSDFIYKFKIDQPTILKLIEQLDRALKFFLEHEVKVSFAEVTDYEAIKGEITAMLQKLAESHTIYDKPLIYHLDVGSMYPNIILTNRLQPSAMVSESACAVCDFNRPGKQCQRKMTWSWRGEFFSAKQNEYKMIKRQLEGERFPSKYAKGATVPFHELNQAEQNALLKKRLTTYSQKVYKKTRQHEVVQKTSIVCQRENAFYIDTVRSFRDRRYDYKNLQKVWKKRLDEAQSSGGDPARVEEAGKLLVLYDSLQLAHKCILNSFYGYVMRKAARWYSMEMGGIVCETGAAIITLARQLIEQFGRPLELDTDGIWCMLPGGFPQNFSFSLNNGKKVFFAYPCVMLNHLLFDKFTNHQYQTLLSDGTYAISSENSIFFEIDGPYKAMVLPSSTEEGKQLKKRYAVFNEDSSLAELKGFEIKRRGELQLIKIFQSQIFKTFLKGGTLTECYQEVASVANYWLDILYSRGSTMEDDELIELISENRSMSRSLEDYGEQKSTSISTARRLAEFLGEAMVKDRGLACKFIISARPIGVPVTSRAIPVAIFSAAAEVKRHFLSKWLKDPNLAMADIREIIDWEYYLERIGSMIQKLIVIPAALQNVPNPVPRVIPPEWLKRKSAGPGAGHDRREQTKLTSIFKLQSKVREASDTGGMVKTAVDIEETIVTKNVNTTTEAFPMFHGQKKRPVAAIDSLSSLALPQSLESLFRDLPSGLNMNEDYQAWLVSRKSFWRAIPEVIRKQQRQGDLNSRKLALNNLLVQDRLSVLAAHWEIISVQPTGRPGEFKLWALLAGTLRPFQLVSSRRIYISTFEEVEGIGHRVHLRLPRDSPARILYEVVMPEAVYENEFVPSLTSLMDPNVEGLWETKIPLDFQLTLRLGAVASINKATRKNSSVKETFTPEEFDFCTTKEVPYLEDSRLCYAFLGSLSSADHRHILILAMSTSPMIRLLVVDDGMHRQLTTVRALAAQLLKSTVQSDIKGPFDCNFEGGVEFEVDYYADIGSARRSLLKLLNNYLDDRQSPPTILLTLSNPLAWDEISFPVLTRIPSIPISPWLGPFVFPPLDWQRGVTRRLLEYYLGLNSWLEQRLALCRYAHIPLANLPGEDPHLYISDVFCARMFRAQGYVLPWNDEPGSLVPRSVGGPALRRQLTLVATPGLYRHVTVDLELSAVAVNAVLEQSHLALEFEKTPPAFLLLKTLLTNWIKEAVHGNAQAGQFVEGAFRWIRSGASRLLPPDLLDHLLKLMGRALGRLHSFVRHLGCTIVYGDTYRLLLATAKDHIDNAQAFTEYLLGELKRTDGVAWIAIRPVAYWQTLLWMDQGNYAGFLCAQSNQGSDDQGSTMTKDRIELRLNLADYLPSILQKPFMVLVAEYVAQTRTLLGKLILESGGVSAVTATSDDTLIESFLPSDMDSPDNGYDGPDSNDQLMISAEYRTKFLSIVREVQKIFLSAPTSAEDQERRSFPIRVGSHLNNLGEGPVAFVRFLGALLQLDQHASAATFSLLKHAYTLLGVGEFSEAAIYQDPCCSFLLPDLICSACQHCRHVDFCRDIDVLAALGRGGQLICPVCTHPYDMEAMEEEILACLQDDLVDYQRQDLICSKCKMAKADLMTLICPCTGSYQLEDLSRTSLQNRIQVLTRVADALNMYPLMAFLKSITSTI